MKTEMFTFIELILLTMVFVIQNLSIRFLLVLVQYNNYTQQNCTSLAFQVSVIPLGMSSAMTLQKRYKSMFYVNWTTILSFQREVKNREKFEQRALEVS